MCTFVGIRILEEPWIVHGKAARAPRSVVGGRGTYAFFLLSLLFLFCSPVLPLGGAAKPGKRREPLRRTVSDRGPRGSAVSLEEGEGARPLRVRSYQR